MDKVKVYNEFLKIQHKDIRRKELNGVLEKKLKRLDELGTQSTDYLDAVDRGFHKEKIRVLQHEVNKLLSLAIADNEVKRRIAEKINEYNKRI